jgi:hypothetical protein
VSGEVFVRAAGTSGRLAVLDNGSVLEGDIERVGDQYRIRRTIGELWLPAEKVQCVCASFEEAYLFLRGQANLRDPDERLRLARWCKLHGLKAQALAEISAGIELRPQHAESRLLWQSLQRPEKACPVAPKPREETDDGPPPVVEYNAESLGLFVTRVQPILMNTCATCHATGRGGAFKLIRTPEGALTNRRATQQNLAAVLAQVNRDKPQQSLLLSRAVSVHGDAEAAPLKGRQTPAYHILEDWVQLALVNTMPHEPTAATGPATEPHGFADMLQPKTTPAAASATNPPAAPVTPSAPTPAAPVVTATPAPLPQPAAAPPAPATAPGPEDPFDPAIFNRQMHPEKQ